MSDYSSDDDDQLPEVWVRFTPLIHSLLISMENSPMAEQERLATILRKTYSNAMKVENCSKIDRYVSLAMNEGLPIKRGTIEGKTFYWFNLDGETFKYLALAKEDLRTVSIKEEEGLDSIEEEFEKLSLNSKSTGSSSFNNVQKSKLMNANDLISSKASSNSKKNKLDQSIIDENKTSIKQELEENGKSIKKKKQDEQAKKIFYQITNLQNKPFSNDSQMCGIILALIKFTLQNPDCVYPRTISFKNLFDFIEKNDDQLLTVPNNPNKSKKRVLNDLLIRGMIDGKMPIWFNIEGRMIHFKKIKNLVNRCTN